VVAAVVTEYVEEQVGATNPVVKVEEVAFSLFTNPEYVTLITGTDAPYVIDGEDAVAVKVAFVMLSNALEYVNE
jgi:tRNA A37 threonylcarbamoyladenosine dehydratase